MIYWVGCDLDGTLARYDGWVSEDHIGEPVPLMVERVKKALEEGFEVRIFTARVGPGNDVERAQKAIEAWCLEHIGQVLPVTCQKDYGMIECWDDRSIEIQTNTGVRRTEALAEIAYDLVNTIEGELNASLGVTRRELAKLGV